MCAHLEGAACVVLTSLNVVQGQSSGKKRRRRKHLPERIDVEVTEKEQKEQKERELKYKVRSFFDEYSTIITPP